MMTEHTDALLEAVNDVKRSIALLNQSMAAMQTQLNKVSDDHEARLRSLEKWMYAIPPSLLAGLVGLTMSIAQLLSR